MSDKPLTDEELFETICLIARLMEISGTTNDPEKIGRFVEWFTHCDRSDPLKIHENKDNNKKH